MNDGLLFAAGILVCFAAASLFFAVTTTTEIRKALAAAETRVFRRQSRISLALALMLGFLPRFFECWENADNAARARCCPGGIRRIMVILPLVTERMIETAADTAEALESRGLN
jgi:biotin transport system permease protein